MRTALILLLLLALAAIAGSLVPQQGNSPLAVAAQFREHPLRADVYNAIGLFDVYGSWWFTLIYVLLLVSLGACLVPRTRAFVRTARTRPQPARELDAFPQYAERTVEAPPEEALTTTRTLLRRRMFRVNRTGPGALAADKGIAREGGSLLFHWAFFLILIGVVFGKGTGFTGYAVITEGECWTDAAANYDGNLQQGRFVGTGDHTGTRICVSAFEDTYWRTGVPMDFVTTAEFVAADGEPLGEESIRVNHPASRGGIQVYQFAYGWSPVIEVRRGGELLASGPVQFEKDPAPEGVGELALPWHGVVRLPSTRPQTGIEFVLWPDSRAFVEVAQGRDAPMMTAVYQPVMLFRAYRGDLASELLPGAATLDTRGLQEWTSGVVGADRTVDLQTGKAVEAGPDGFAPPPEGLSVTFRDLRQYTVLQISRDRGQGIVLIGAACILIGLLLSLYTSRRKIWVQARAEGETAVVRIAGYALQRTSRFEDEFPKLVDEVARACGQPNSPAPEKVGSR